MATEKGPTPEEKVAKDMHRNNLKVEAFRDDEWHIVY